MCKTEVVAFFRTVSRILFCSSLLLFKVSELLAQNDSLFRTYSYKIEPYNKSLYTGTEKQLLISELPYGSFVFLVNVATNGITENEVLSVPIQIRRPFYFKAWFLLLVLFAISFGLFWYIRKRRKEMNNTIVMIDKNIVNIDSVIEDCNCKSKGNVALINDLQGLLQQTMTSAKKSLERVGYLQDDTLSRDTMNIIQHCEQMQAVLSKLQFSGQQELVVREKEVGAAAVQTISIDDDRTEKKMAAVLAALVPESGIRRGENSEMNLNAFDKEFLERARNFILEHLNETDFGAKELAQYLGLGKTQMHRKITALTGLSPGRFVYQLRLEEARKMLPNTNLTIAEIAYSTGFSDPGYFTRLFTREFGHPPSFYR